MSKQQVIKLSRRKFILYSAAAAAATAIPLYLVRTSYPVLNGWNGKILSPQQAQIIMAACEVFIANENNEEIRLTIARNIDRYIYSLPEDLVSQLNLLFTVTEHFTFIDLHTKRFTKLSVPERKTFLDKLGNSTTDLRLVCKTLRELCMMGYYQTEIAWKEINYTGPIIGPAKRQRAEKYALLAAAQSELPKAIVNNTHDI